MSNLKKPGRIRDPSHGYVRFTGLEREILDHPVAQRLRHVSQSGMAQLVFPEVRSTRFSHSLGAMHLASRFLGAAIGNADQDTRLDIERRLDPAVRKHWRMGMTEENLRRVDEDLSRQGLHAGAVVSDRVRPLALLVEQGLRLAALFHDLGHLPFSHDFEYALDAAIRKHVQGGGDAPSVLGSVGRLAIHETVGYKLATLLQHDIFGRLDAPRWVEASFMIAEEILNARTVLDPDQPPGLGGPADANEGLYQWLHSFIAGELDVDRCDYILRDARHYGFEFVSFDLARLVDNIVACRAATVKDALFNSVLPQGQSAVESFVIARYRMYQWGVFHHKMQQAAAAFQKSTRDILIGALRDGRYSVHEFLWDIEAIAAAEEADPFLDQNPGILDRFAGYDDVWWTGLMRERAKDDPQDPWLALICRRARGPHSLWKRQLDFPHPNLQAFNHGLPKRGDDASEVAWQAAVAELEGQEVLVLRQRFQPWKSRNEREVDLSALSVRQSDGGTKALSELSRLVHGLRDSWMNDVQVQAFSAREGSVDAETVLSRLAETTTTQQS